MCTSDQPRGKDMAMNFSIDSMECQEFGDYLLDKGLHESVLSNILDNQIGGQLFISLSEGEIKSWHLQLEIKFRLRKFLDEERTVI